VSDFLRHLVDRSRSNVPALMPRLPSRFEAPPSEAFAATSEGESIVNAVDFVVAEPQRDSAQVITRPIDPASSLPPGLDEYTGTREAVVSPEFRSTQPPARRVRPSAATRRVISDPKRAADRPRPNPIAPQDISLIAIPEANSPEWVVTIHDSAAVQPADSANPPPRIPTRVVTAITRQVSERPLADEPLPLRRSRVHSGQPSAAAVRRTSPGPAPSPVDTAAKSTVHVAIGRIEIRATQPLPARSRTRERAEPTSLDDYLAQRNGRN
jgi:hypothetical protein